ncbi:BrnT family toxin [Halomonas sp. McH1-25]|uniref:BrnT family toxin n=1 Tax=unclassified Halomonas TaxID=2609666 RepID=UPI001EF44800|nr:MULTISPECIES: BrnT family toxin [unclassified Halomonas]MCG7599723.1 BrnT family toxin [Halomonas sp. McH1-25]MCP1342807.1 BrnT family toxin [Halomonas sp. FL8]MCP1360877.1 BrnT family toxin [Halomonas sp. BBD45]MCP1364593.1 BrnT family toxin [Halomonas sp. BBD48]
MRIEFDPDKSARNERERGLPFTVAERFDWEGALYAEDMRYDYPERRFVALGRIGQRVHVVCFTPIDGGVRIISFRKANAREVRRYEQATDR